MTDQTFDIINESEQIEQRKAKLKALRDSSHTAYPNDFKPTHTSTAIKESFDELSTESLEEQAIAVTVAGRIMFKRIMGKASFFHIRDRMGNIQLYVSLNHLSADLFETTKKWDLGDIIGAEGLLFKTKTGELTVRVTQIRLLTKALRPLPEKFHGLRDKETCYRQRYLDLMMSLETRERFKARNRTIQAIRDFLVKHDFLEVETPMMQVLPGGAAAKPFVTHHNALDMPLYLRIAPELYLKRIIVGGIERVFEINRNFRNEGLSRQHNPEFTMVEFYQAYATYEDLMDFTEELFCYVAKEVVGSTRITVEGAYEINFANPFQRFTMLEAILHFNPNLTAVQLQSLEAIRQVCDELAIPYENSWGVGKLQAEIFDKTVEAKLEQPTFITGYPVEISPLARRNDKDPFITDRFELFIAGKEIANAFSELNDPEDQAARFEEQMQAKTEGDEEAMPFDEDYVRALEYGMPPTGGEGIGIDRLVMLLTNTSSIKDVLLFPHMRPKEMS